MTVRTAASSVRVVLVLGALTTLAPFALDLYLPALPALVDELGASAAAGQASLTVMLLGIAVGQLVFGPISDRTGRRVPIVGGLLVHALCSVLVALTADMTALIVIRAVQGVAGGAVGVAVMALARDLTGGTAMARLLSRLTLVTGVAPIVAPLIGGALLQVTDWRGLFFVLAGIAIALVAVACVPLGNGGPARVSGALTGGALGRLFRDPLFCVMVVISGLAYGLLFTYISVSPFALQSGLGMDEVQFALAFGANATAMIIASQLNAVIVVRRSPQHALVIGASLIVVGALATVASALWLPAPILFCLCLSLATGALGFVLPNAPALALANHGRDAGTAASFIGAAQFLLGGLLAPLALAVTGGTPLGLGMSIVALGLVLLLIVLAARRVSTQPKAGQHVG